MASTIVDATSGALRVVRQGAVTLEQLREVAPVLGPDDELAAEAAPEGQGPPTDALADASTETRGSGDAGEPEANGG